MIGETSIPYSGEERWYKQQYLSKQLKQLEKIRRMNPIALFFSAKWETGADFQANGPRCITADRTSEIPAP